MAELITSISRSDTIPIVKPLSVSSSKGRITLDVSSFTPRMFYELPAIRFEIYTETDGTRVKYNTSDNVIRTYQPDLFPDCDKVVIPIKNIPEDCYIYITPIFDNEAIAARNMLIENGIESGEIWDNALTQTFPITIGFDVEPGGGGGGGSYVIVPVTVDLSNETWENRDFCYGSNSFVITCNKIVDIPKGAVSVCAEITLSNGYRADSCFQFFANKGQVQAYDKTDDTSYTNDDYDDGWQSTTESKHIIPYLSGRYAFEFGVARNPISLHYTISPSNLSSCTLTFYCVRQESDLP